MKVLHFKCYPPSFLFRALDCHGKLIYQPQILSCTFTITFISLPHLQLLLLSGFQRWESFKNASNKSAVTVYCKSLRRLIWKFSFPKSMVFCNSHSVSRPLLSLMSLESLRNCIFSLNTCCVHVSCYQHPRSPSTNHPLAFRGRNWFSGLLLKQTDICWVPTRKTLRCILFFKLFNKIRLSFSEERIRRSLEIQISIDKYDFNWRLNFLKWLWVFGGQ